MQDFISTLFTLCVILSSQHDQLRCSPYSHVVLLSLAPAGSGADFNAVSTTTGVSWGHIDSVLFHTMIRWVSRLVFQTLLEIQDYFLGQKT